MRFHLDPFECFEGLVVSFALGLRGVYFSATHVCFLHFGKSLDCHARLFNGGDHFHLYGLVDFLHILEGEGEVFQFFVAELIGAEGFRHIHARHGRFGIGPVFRLCRLLAVCLWIAGAVAGIVIAARRCEYDEEKENT